jgi:hypothetical protein
VTGYGLFVGLLLVSILFVALVWLLRRATQWVAQQYTLKHFSDRMLLIDAWWLTFTLWEVLIFSASSNLSSAVILSFVAYKVTLWFILQKSLMTRQEPAPAPRLLWLRVFGRQEQSTELLDSIGNKWRNVGSIQMIAGTDFAATFMEPHQLIEFWLGKLRQQFIQSYDQLTEQIQQIDLLPDHDGRYRISQFFCSNDNWKFVFDRLLQQRNTVLVDLRGLKESSQGVRHELETLFNQVPARGFTILVDEPYPEHPAQTLQELWQRVSTRSPNFDRPFSEVNLIEVNPTKTDQIVKSLFESVALKALHPQP